MVMRPSASMPMTPAVTPDEHRLGEAAAAVDQLARRDQLVALAAELRGHRVEGLAERAEVAVGPRRTGTWTHEIAGDTCLAASIRRRIGATRRLAKLMPSQIADSSTTSEMPR